MANYQPLSLDRIEHASRTINPVFLNSPQFVSEELGQTLGCSLQLKVETVNPIRSFKGRGADFYFSRTSSKGPIVCASVGNFGQGMAYAARLRGMALTVFASTTANEAKLARIRMLGADIIQDGIDFDAAKIAARRYANEHGFAFVEDGIAAEISEGAGTIALELLKHGPRPDAILVPVGNGALINGIGSVIKALRPEIQIIGICAEGAPAMQRAFQSGSIHALERIDTVAEGIGVRIPIAEAVELMRAVVDQVVLVGEASMLHAIRLCHSTHGLVVEPAGAAGVAAMIQHPKLCDGLRMATVLCGGNLTTGQYQEWLGCLPPR